MIVAMGRMRQQLLEKVPSNDLFNLCPGDEAADILFQVSLWTQQHVRTPAMYELHVSG